MKTKKNKPHRTSLKKALPISGPLLLMDKILRYKENEEIVIQKYITGKEWFFKGHFPGNPVMPGHMIAEAMAQTCALFFKNAAGRKEGKLFYLAETKMRFFRIVKPKSNLIIKIWPVRIFSIAGIFKGEAYVRNKLVAKGEFKMAAKA